jgi:hypothetical protein
MFQSELFPLYFLESETSDKQIKQRSRFFDWETPILCCRKNQSFAKKKKNLLEHARPLLKQEQQYGRMTTSNNVGTFCICKTNHNFHISHFIIEIGSDNGQFYKFLEKKRWTK